jgi:glycerophosphoryl diester phosphodiesterase
VQLGALALLLPLATAVARLLVRSSGSAVISNYDIARFVLSPAGVAFVLFVAAIALGLLLAEFAGLSWIASHALAGRRVPVVSTVALVLRRLPALLVLATRVFLRLLLLALPFLAGVGLLWLATLREHDINYYLAGQPPEWRRALVVAGLLGAGYGLLAARQLARWLYAVPLIVFERLRPSLALRESARRTDRRLRRILPPLLLWWFASAVIALAIAWLGRLVSDAGLDWAGVDFRRVLPLVALYLGVALPGALLATGVQLAGHQFLVTRRYAEQADVARFTPSTASEPDEARSVRLARPAILAILALAAISAGVAWVGASALDPESEVAITAHRGASVRAPENTLAAIAAGATYMELDVQRTRDGVVVVLHDADFMRMAGDPRRVGALRADEVAGIDIGRRYGAAFTGERAPTLREVIALARGRIGINVELKYNVPDPGLAPAVVELLRREDFVDQVVVTSLDARALRQIRGIEPRLPTGLIVTAAVGNVVRTDADFLSLNAARATPQLLRRARAAGKQVHVWTVNRPDLMLRMIERGVDNIITDDPALLARVIRDRRELDPGELLALRLRVLFDHPPRELTDPQVVPVL